MYSLYAPSSLFLPSQLPYLNASIFFSFVLFLDLLSRENLRLHTALSFAAFSSVGSAYRYTFPLR